MSSAEAPGCLLLVATPIGNLGDVTPRAVEAIRDADVVLAEDTRRARALLARNGIERPVGRFDAHRERAEARRMVERIAAGDTVALLSDAGTPCISDPGATLVRAAHAAGLRIVPIPGASAVTAAVAAAGVTGGFLFLGFLPRKGTARQRSVDRIREAEEAVVVFESPRRIGSTLAHLASALGPDREAVLCRELTKLHEEIASGAIGVLAERFSGGVLGETTIVILPTRGGAGRAGAQARAAPTPERLAAVLSGEGVAPTRAARIVAESFGLSRSDAYAVVERSRAHVTVLR